MKIFEHLTQLDNAVGFYRKGIIAILIVCAILMTAMYIHTETRILQATSSAYILNQDGDVAIATRIRAAEFRKIEAEAHVRLFIMLFFDIDKYTYEQRIAAPMPLETRQYTHSNSGSTRTTGLRTCANTTFPKACR